MCDDLCSQPEDGALHLLLPLPLVSAHVVVTTWHAKRVYLQADEVVSFLSCNLPAKRAMLCVQHVSLYLPGMSVIEVDVIFVVLWVLLFVVFI